MASEARPPGTGPGRSAGAPAWSPPAPAELGPMFPGYEILSLLGRGGMGAVYYAVQKALDRPVALKLLPAEVSAHAGFADRFTREARAMAKLNHPNIVSVFDFGTTAGGHLYFVMEFVEGTTLAALIHGPGMNPQQALAVAGQICLALAYAHGRGVVHRDMKPANVLVDTGGNAKVADFGLARLLDPTDLGAGHTVTGEILGTPDYMAPEQKRGMAVDHRADIYSLGVMLYEMLCGQTPQGAFTPPSEIAGCDAGVDRIVEKAMQQQPERRYQSTQEMKVDMDDARRRAPRRGRRRALLWLGAAAVVALAALAAIERFSRRAIPGATAPDALAEAATAAPGAAAAARDSDRTAAAWVLRSGGIVRVSLDGETRDVDQAADLPAEPCELVTIYIDRYKDRFPMPPLEGYRTLADVRQLHSIFLNDLSATDDSLAFLSNNERLVSVSMHNLPNITPATFAHLASLPALGFLAVTDCARVDPAGLDRFASRGVLRTLHFGRLPVSREDLEAIAAFPALEELGLISCPVNDELLPALAPMPVLRRLDLGDCREVTGTGLDRLAGIGSLRLLRLVGSGLTDRGCASLAMLTQLTELELQQTAVSDAGLTSLARLGGLQKLNLNRVAVSAAAVDAFQAAVPGCKVVR